LPAGWARGLRPSGHTTARTAATHINAKTIQSIMELFHHLAAPSEHRTV
jgi:hypothetical protein